MGKVSIVLPTYNRAYFLKQSIDSCLNQTYQDIELIVINDASTDNTGEVIKSYNDSRIKYLSLDQNIGQIRALNKGFAVSTGKYLTWTSDDNYYAADAIEKMVDFLSQHPKISLVYTNFFCIDKTGKVFENYEVGAPERLLDYNTIGPCFLYRREVYRVIGDYNVITGLAADYDYWVRVYKQFKMQKIDNFLYYLMVHKDSLTYRHGFVTAKYYAKQLRNKHFRLYKQFVSTSLFKIVNSISPILTRQMVSMLKYVKKRTCQK